MSIASIHVSDLPEVTYEKGYLLFEEGKPGKSVYVLKEGQVSIVAGGNEICKVDDKDTIFGEISILLNCPASASVVVEQKATFHVIEDLKAYMHEQPDFAVHVSRILAKRVADMNKYYVQIKQELVKSESNPAARFSKKLWDLVVKVDRFWGREVL